MNFVNQLGTWGYDIANAYVGGISNATDADEVNIKAANTQIAIAKQKFVNDENRKDRLINILTGLITFVALLGLVAVLANVAKKMK